MSSVTFSIFGTRAQRPNCIPMKRILIIVLLILNAIVLLGQLWPEGAPPFARTVNVIFLVAVMLYLLAELLGGRRARS